MNKNPLYNIHKLLDKLVNEKLYTNIKNNGIKNSKMTKHKKIPK